MDPDVAKQIDLVLESQALLADSFVMSIETALEAVKRLEAEGCDDEVKARNLAIFANRFDFTYFHSIRGMNLEMKALHKDWQLKMGQFNQALGEWIY